MRRRKYYKIRRRRKKRGKGLPYIFKNKVYLGKRPQTGTGAVSRVIAVYQKTLETLPDFNVQKEVYEKIKQKI